MLHSHWISDTMIATKRDERLRNFFGAYFNQDWDLGGATSWRDVLTEFHTETDEEQLRELKDDLRSWLSDAFGDDNVLDGCDFNPGVEGLTVRQWLEEMVEELDRRLNASPRKP